MIYQQPVTQLLEFIRAQFGSQFKEYYDGDPDLIPEFNLPAIVVVKNSDQNSNGPTGMRRVTEQLVIKIIMDKKDDWHADVDPTQLTEKRIRDLVEARDPATGAYLTTTLKYAIMHRFTVNGLTLDDSMTFELGILPRPNEMFTQEGHLTLTLDYLVPNAF